MFKPYCLLLFLLVAFTACNVEKEPAETEDHQIGATINGEQWYFYDASFSQTEGGTTLTANGYLANDRGAEPANLRVTFVGINSPAELTEGYTADFAPTSSGTSAIATLRLPQQSRSFDTKLDPQARGTFTVTSIEENMLNGTFDFTMKDQQGNALDFKDAEFKNIPLPQ